ncbi:MAG: response regulator [Magnetococcales bacterium]|nr:response regulator [Magnetococcales bacterium]
MTQKEEGRTLADVLNGGKDELLASWIRNILGLPGNRTLKLMTELQLRGQAGELLDALLDAFRSENHEDIHTPEYAAAVELLREISASRAKQGFTPTETAVFVFSLKDAALPILQEAFDTDRARLAQELIRLNTALDKLGLVTFESYAEAREKVITEQSRAMVELAEAANRAKSLFLASMSHEIRTPIHAITGLGELLKEGNLSTEERGYVEIINRAGESLLALVNDILDLSKIEAGQFEMERRPMSLRQVIDNAVGILNHRARDKGLKLLWQVDDDVPERMMGDPGRLRQILLNLAGNAIKFTPSGEVRIHVGIQNREIRISVTDTGIGIPEEKREIIFEPFIQSDASTSRQYGGTGLGLAICRQLVEKMGGVIRLESAVGRGSAFHLLWPLESVAEDAQLKKDPDHPASTPAPDAESLPEGRTGRILLADDAPENRLIIKAFLKKSPWRIDVAKDGAEAFLKFTQNDYDLALMDVEMPVMDGYAATRAIRDWEREHERPKTPVLALTAHAMREHRERSLEAGCDGHLTKPIGKERLIRSIQKVLERKDPVEMAT